MTQLSAKRCHRTFGFSTREAPACLLSPDGLRAPRFCTFRVRIFVRLNGAPITTVKSEGTVRSRLLSTAAALSLCCSAFSITRPVNILASPTDWPQWRGPERNGISQEQGLLKQWPTEGPKLLWQMNDIGDGYSTPAVVGSRIY